MLKVFLTASAEVRAERRYKQLIEKGIDANLAQPFCADIEARDERDSARSTAPLQMRSDALLDTSESDHRPKRWQQVLGCSTEKAVCNGLSGCMKYGPHASTACGFLIIPVAMTGYFRVR